MSNPHFHIPFPPSVNHLYANTRFGRVKTSEYKTWIAEGSIEVRRQGVKPVTGAVVVSYVAHKPNKRRRDLANLLKALDDLLVTIGLIEDDSLICGYDELRWGGVGDMVWCRIREALPCEREDALL